MMFKTFHDIEEFYNTLVLKTPDQNLNKIVRKSIADVMHYVDFHFYRAYLTGVVFKNRTNEEKHINNRVRLFIHQIMCVSKKLPTSNQ